MTNADATIIIPVYQDQLGLNACLAALNKQDYRMEKVQVIIVDNNSNPAIIIEKKFRYDVQLMHCETPGSYAARNVGVRNAAGTILAFIDADCTPERSWLENAISELEKGQGKIIVGGHVGITLPARTTATALYQHLAGFQQKENIEEKLFAATANLVCYASQMRIIGLFNEDLLSGGDREWCWRAVNAHFNIVYAREAVVWTAPRTTLRAAIRQARRVAGGRYQLRRRGLAYLGTALIERRQTNKEAVLWILRHPDIGWFQRFRVLSAAITIRVATALEYFRLRCGGKAERR